MAGFELSQLTPLGAAPAPGDKLLILDVSDTSTPPADSAGSDKTVTYEEFLSSVSAGGTLPEYIAPKVVTLADGSSVALDASLGNTFRWQLGGASHTLGAPSNAVDSEVIKVRIIYGGAYTPLFSAAYTFPAGQPAWASVSGKVDTVGFERNADAASGAGAWTCVGWTLGA